MDGPYLTVRISGREQPERILLTLRRPGGPFCCLMDVYGDEPPPEEHTPEPEMAPALVRIYGVDVEVDQTLLPHLDTMIHEGMITMEHVMIAAYRSGSPK